MGARLRSDERVRLRRQLQLEHGEHHQRRPGPRQDRRGQTPYAVAYDGTTGALDVVDSGVDAISIVSTALWVGPPSAFPAGDPVGSSDVAQNVTFNATLYGIGAGGNNVTVEVAPGLELGCPSYVTLVLNNGSGAISAPCRPNATGTYLLTFLVTDQLGNSVRSTIDFVVYPPPSVAAPVVRFQGHAAAINSSDVGQRLVFYATLTGGTG